MKKKYKRGDFIISTDKSGLDIRVIHNFLSNSYWAKGRPLKTMKQAIDNSLCFGLYYKNSSMSKADQIGFARVITDYATFAYIADVFILEEYRGKGLSKWLMEIILDYDKLKNLKRWSLATRDAHGLYEKFGFHNLKNPENFMEMSKIL